MRLTILKMVVLPAPLGPMMANISPCLTEKPTPSTALRPPKYSARSVTVSSAMSVGNAMSASPQQGGMADQPRPGLRHDRVDAVRLKHQHQDQRCAEQKWAQPRQLGITRCEQPEQPLHQFRRHHQE